MNLEYKKIVSSLKKCNYFLSFSARCKALPDSTVKFQEPLGIWQSWAVKSAVCVCVRLFGNLSWPCTARLPTDWCWIGQNSCHEWCCWHHLAWQTSSERSKQPSGKLCYLKQQLAAEIPPSTTFRMDGIIYYFTINILSVSVRKYFALWLKYCFPIVWADNMFS